MPSEFQRNTAKIVKISGLINSQFVKEEGMKASYVLIKGEQVSRVNVIGTVISVHPETKSFAIDDGSAAITLREFDTNFASNVGLGDIVLVVGKIKEYSMQRYILPEIIKKTTIGWLKQRSAELSSGKKEASQYNEVTEDAPEIKSVFAEKPARAKVEEEVVENEEKEQSLSNKILTYIRKNDSNDGVDMDEIIEKLKIDDKDIENLLKSGDIFLVKPGRVKVLE